MNRLSQITEVAFSSSGSGEVCLLLFIVYFFAFFRSYMMCVISVHLFVIRQVTDVLLYQNKGL